jgi:predicted Fe-Mo cluster-binding NifX family protein
MKVAVPRYRGRISPRFGFSEDVLIAEVTKGKVRLLEIMDVGRAMSHQVASMLSQRGVNVVLTGGINMRDQALLRSMGIEVIWGLIGTPEDAIESLMNGEIIPGMGVCPPCRHRHRQRGGPPWV